VHRIVVGAVALGRHHGLQDLRRHILKDAVLTKLGALLGVRNGELHGGPRRHWRRSSDQP